MSSLLVKSVLINAAVSGAMVFSSLHYLSSIHHGTFHEMYVKHHKIEDQKRKRCPYPIPYMFWGTVVAPKDEDAKTEDVPVQE